MSSVQKVINSNGFKEFGGVSHTNLNGNTQSMSAQLSNSSLPTDADYEFSTDPSFVAVSGATGQTTLVAGVDGRQISVMSYTIILDAASTFQIFSSGTSASRTPISGPMAIAANGGVSANDNDIMYRTEAGESLVVNNSAGNFAGHIAYKFG
tara:strand:+ start:461 stop:916 length:456 start_codon:yes stop_codon:yes gene_type:complete